MRHPFLSRNTVLAAAIVACAAATSTAFAVDVKVTLSGDNETPAVKSIGKGSAFFAVSNDRKVTGQVNVVGIKPTAAHIHEGEPGKAGPVVIPLVKDGEGFSVPPNVMLSDAQYAAFQAGKLYVNVHTEANPNGELRGQLKP